MSTENYHYSRAICYKYIMLKFYNIVLLLYFAFNLLSGGHLLHFMTFLHDLPNTTCRRK